MATCDVKKRHETEDAAYLKLFRELREIVMPDGVRLHHKLDRTSIQNIACALTEGGICADYIDLVRGEHQPKESTHEH